MAGSGDGSQRASDESAGDEIAVAVGSGLLAGVAEAVVGGGAGIVVGGVAGPLVPLLIQRANQREAENATAVLSTAADELGVDFDGLADRLFSDPRAELLADQAVRAGVMTVLDEKVSALGMALAAGLQDDAAKLDLSAVIISALADMELPHVRVLEWFGKDVRETADDRWVITSWYAPAADDRDLREKFPNFSAGVDGIIAVLESHGLIALVPQDLGRQIDEKRRMDNLGFSGSTSLEGIKTERVWKIAPMGWEVLKYLRARGRHFT